MTQTRMCWSCEQEKPLTEFYKNKNRKGGREYRCADCSKEAHRQYYEENKNKVLQRGKDYRERIKYEVIGQYGGSCACCGDTEPRRLVIDHVDGGGNGHREKVGEGHVFYLWLKREEWPDGFQVLCASCNLAKESSGCSPHKMVIL